MTVLLKACQTMPPVRLFAIVATMLAATAIQPCSAQNPTQANPDLAAVSEAGTTLATDGLASSGFGFSFHPNASTIGSDEPAENSYDFTNPDRIPGFASQPYAVPSNSEILD